MIGIFDSGLGGLTIFKEVEKRLPQYDYVYLGDNARAPYGDHSQETILKYTTQAVEYLFKQSCQLVLLGCNTASAEALRSLQQRLPKRYPGRNILGVIRPLAEAAAESTRNKKVAVLGTRSTIDSQAYRREIKKLDPKITVLQQACRLLVPLIEEGLEHRPASRMILKNYLRQVKSHHPDTVVLGCTHYGIMARDISRYFGRNAIVLDSGTIVAEKFAEYLKRHPEYEKKLSRGGRRDFLTTETTDAIAPLAKKFLGRDISFGTAVLGAVD